MLGIEVDGSSHAHRKEYDEIRTNDLNTANIKIIRYSNFEVMNDVSGVYKSLIGQVRIRERELGI